MRAFAQTRPWCASPRVLCAHVSVVMSHARQPCFPKLLWLIVYLLDGYWSVDLFHASNARLIDLSFHNIYPRHFGLTHADNRTTLTLCKHSSRGWLCFIYLFEASKAHTWKCPFVSCTLNPRLTKGHFRQRFLSADTVKVIDVLSLPLAPQASQL